MPQHRPPVQRLSEIGVETVQRSPRGAHPAAGALAAIFAVLVLGVGVAVGWRAGAPLLQQAEPALRSVLAQLGIAAPLPAPAPAPGQPVPALERLHAAIVAGDSARAQALIPRIAPQALDSPLAGMTALMHAASAGDAQLVRALIDAGADANARGSLHRTALQYAAENNRLEAARVLLDAGADIDGVDSGSLSPLVMAADRDFTDLALMLIARGANVNIQNVDGWTALMDAARRGNARVAEALLAAGARTGARHRNGWTAADFAREAGHDEVLRLLNATGHAAPALRTGAARPPRTGTPTSDPTLPPKKGARP